MRAALLSIIQPSDCAGGGYRAFIDFAGRSIARRQLDLALALGCERVICLADYLHQPMLALQHHCEAAGARFHTISGAQALMGLVKSTDELVVLTDGLLPLASDGLESLANGNCVLVFPSETGIPAGFERVDLNSAWAGALVMPGRLVERLGELPTDCDAVAALLRIALQARVPEVALPDALLSDGRWSIVTSPAQAALVEPVWLRRHFWVDGGVSPGRHAAGRILALFGLALSRRGDGGSLAMLAAFILALLGAAVGLALWVPAGFVLIGLSCLAAEVSAALNRLESATSNSKPRVGIAQRIRPWLTDVILAALVSKGVLSPLTDWIGAIFFGVTMLGTARLVATLLPGLWQGLASDRFALAIMLAVAGLAGFLLPAVQGLTLILLASGLAFQQVRQR